MAVFPTATANGVWLRTSYEEAEERQWDGVLSRWGAKRNKSISAQMYCEKPDSQAAIGLVTTVLPSIYIAGTVVDSLSGDADWIVESVRVQDQDATSVIQANWVQIPVTYGVVT